MSRLVAWFADRPLAHGALGFLIALLAGVVRVRLGSAHADRVLPASIGIGLVAGFGTFASKRLAE